LMGRKRKAQNEHVTSAFASRAQAPTPRHVRSAPERTCIGSLRRRVSANASGARGRAPGLRARVAHSMPRSWRATGDAVLKKNQKADAAASAVAKINNR